MNRTKNLLIGLVTVVAMPAFADTKTTTSSSDENRLEALFKADLQYRSESEIRRCRGCRRTRRCLHRKWRWNGDRRSASRSGSLVAMVWECPYPLIRSGQSVPGGLHLCTISPAGFIETPDGARIRFDGRGYGLRSSEKYRTNLTLIFSTEDVRYEWLTKVVP